MSIKEATAGTAEALLAAILERIPSVFFKLRATTDALHATAGLRAPERGILRDLSARGPLTAPALAALRPVTRQAIQPVVDSLLERELLVARPNPKHARSPLYDVTARGRRELERSTQKERVVVEGASRAFDATDLAATLRVIERIERDLARRLET